jgi:hypothetical protein
MSDIDSIRLRELLQYDPETGKFIWSVNMGTRIKAGTPAGHICDYKYITIYRKRYSAHRLAWLYIYGEFPIGCIDHINGDTLDNRIANLRLATTAENSQNRYKAQKNNSHGSLGISYDKDKQLWRARIGLDGKRIYIGKFKTKEAAYEAYITAKRELHPYGNL